MTVYTVTPTNWDDPAFWSGISESRSGHTIDFSGLPVNFTVNVDMDSGLATLDNGLSVFSIGDANYIGPANVTLGG